MRKYVWLLLLFAPSFAGCPPADSGEGGNPLISMLKANCAPYCLRYQECNPALFDLKWASLDACEQACDPEMAAAACSANCDTQWANDADRHLKCIDSCNATLSVAGCQVMCEGISDTSARAQCDGSCVKEFSQACADVREGIMECYRALECKRLILLDDFGGSASDLGECTNDNGVSTSC